MRTGRRKRKDKEEVAEEKEIGKNRREMRRRRKG